MKLEERNGLKSHTGKINRAWKRYQNVRHARILTNDEAVIITVIISQMSCERVTVGPECVTFNVTTQFAANFDRNLSFVITFVIQPTRAISFKKPWSFLSFYHSEIHFFKIIYVSRVCNSHFNCKKFNDLASREERYILLWKLKSSFLFYFPVSIGSSGRIKMIEQVLFCELMNRPRKESGQKRLIIEETGCAVGCQ